MCSSDLLAAGATFALAATRPLALLVAAPILALWLLAPALMWWISLPLQRRAAHLSARQTRFLRKLARRTWEFFETFVTAKDHWLPPDNYQEQPVAVLAHRTSPTNMGLALLANLSAWFTGPGRGGNLIARSRVVHAGRSLAVVRTEITAEDGSRVLEATSAHAA